MRPPQEYRHKRPKHIKGDPPVVLPYVPEALCADCGRPFPKKYETYLYFFWIIYLGVLYPFIILGLIHSRVCQCGRPRF